MKIAVENKCSDYNSYRAARVKSLFNVESGCNFSLSAELPIDDDDWKVGLIVGPSGSGKTSLGKKIFPECGITGLSDGWAEGDPIIDSIAPGKSFDDVTAALASVGLGSVPSWLRPFKVLSNGEQFRAGLARLICDAPQRAVIDEFTSVVDRQIARVGALAFQKAWRRTSGKAVLLSCHYDIIDWLEPDWVFDTASGKYSGRGLWRRPKIDVDILETDSSYWEIFEPHHYLKLPKMVAATYYVAFVDGAPVGHIATAPRLEIGAMRACRMVIMPEWQGAGIGVRFLDEVCRMQLEGKNRWGRRCPTYFHTSHPGLCAALRRSKRWSQVSAVMFGGNKKKSAQSISKSSRGAINAGYGGHFRAVQGFKYIGEKPC